MPETNLIRATAHAVRGSDGSEIASVQSIVAREDGLVEERQVLTLGDGTEKRRVRMSEITPRTVAELVLTCVNTAQACPAHADPYLTCCLSLEFDESLLSSVMEEFRIIEGIRRTGICYRLVRKWQRDIRAGRRLVEWTPSKLDIRQRREIMHGERGL